MSSGPDMEWVQFALAWILVGVFAFTAVITCLSLIGIPIIPDQEHRNKLFYVLIVELVVGVVGQFTGALIFGPGKIEEQIRGGVEDQSSPANVEETPAPAPPAQHEAVMIVPAKELTVRPGQARAVTIACANGFAPVGIDPISRFPARIRVDKDGAKWTVEVLNLHGSQRPDGIFKVSLICRATNA